MSPFTPVVARGVALPLRAMYAGVAVTATATLVPLIDLVTLDSLSTHVRAAYPHWPVSLVNADRNAIVIYLSIVGVLGLGGWAWAIRSAVARGHEARRVITILFVLGASVALFGLTFTGGAYDRVLPTSYGILGLLPSLAGLIAVLTIRQLPARDRTVRSAT